MPVISGLDGRRFFLWGRVIITATWSQNRLASLAQRVNTTTTKASTPNSRLQPVVPQAC